MQSDNACITAAERSKGKEKFSESTKIAFQRTQRTQLESSTRVIIRVNKNQSIIATYKSEIKDGMFCKVLEQNCVQVEKCWV